MRPPCPVVLVPSALVGATYDGLHKEIRISVGAATVLDARELAAMLCHEKGHHQLFHIERAVIILVATLIAIMWFALQGDPAGFYWGLAGCALHKLSTIAAEFEADWYSVQFTDPQALLGVFAKQEQHHPDIAGGWLFRARRQVMRWQAN